MKVNTNILNKLRYTLYTPGYDLIANFFKESRKKSIDSLDIKSGDRILIVGAGTGLDLEFLPDNCEIVATDITPSMVDRIIKRNKQLHKNVQAVVMDGQALKLADNSFDIIILHLILAVIPDPVACMHEAERVLRSGGQVVVFDKFVGKNKAISSFRKFVNIFSNIIFSDITRNFESMIENSGFTIVSDKDGGFNGNFRLIKLIKK
ncbi:MAG: methyltransferase domain-containing protein [Patescibacteria group bacterium]